MSGSNVRYDAVLVDEGQDFSDEMYRVVTSVLNPGTNNLTIALDDHQNIYRRKQVWKELGIQARGRTHRLTNVYRNTREIQEFAWKFVRGGDSPAEVVDTKTSLFFGDFQAFHGPKPEIRKFQSMEKVIETVGERIRKLVDARMCGRSDISILYTGKSHGADPGEVLPLRFGEALERRGLLYD